MRDIGDARLDVEEALRPPESLSGTTPRPSILSRCLRAARRRLRWAIAAATLLAIGYAAVWQLERSEFFWRNPLDGAISIKLTNYKGAEHHAAISRDGKVVAFLGNHGGRWDAWSMQVATRDETNLTNGNEKLAELRNPATRTLAFNPDGSLIALWSRVPDPAKGRVHAYWAVPPAGGPLRPYLREMPNALSELDWSPDKKYIVYHPPTDGDPLFVADAEGKGGQEIHRARAGVHCHFPTFSPDGAFVYFVQGLPDDEADIWRIPRAGGHLERMTFHNSRVSFPTFIDHRTLLYLATDQDGLGPWIYVIDVERRRSHRISTGVEAYTSLAGSEDGRRLVATDFRSTGSIWKVPITDRTIDESGASPVPLHTASGLSPRVSPDFVAYRAPRAGTDALWKSLRRDVDEVLYDGLNGRAIGGPAISPSGRLAFVVKNRSVSELWVMNADRSGRRRVAENLDVRGAPDWSPDEQWLAIAANRNGVPRVHKIRVADWATDELVKEYSIDPKWSPSGRISSTRARTSGRICR